jgi:hypothetical protein
MSATGGNTNAKKTSKTTPPPIPNAAVMKDVTRLAITSSPASSNVIAGGNKETSSFTIISPQGRQVTSSP